MYGEFKNDQDTVALWLLQDLTDETGNFDLTDYGSPPLVQARFRDGYDFTFADDQRLYSDAIDQDDIGSQFTIDVICKRDLTTNSNYVFAFNSRTETTTYNLVSLRWEAGSNNLIFSVRGNANPSISVTATVSANEYHFIRAVRDGNTIYLYVDGELVGTDTDTLAGTFILNRWGVGAAWHDQGNYWHSFFDGIIDSVKISTGAKTAKDTKQHWNKINGVYCLT